MTDVGEIDLNLLVALGALLEDRNLTRAGARIGMSQPAMSAALSRLRRHFADELLEREGRGYRLTVFGEQLLPTVQDALRQMEATMQRSPRFDPADSDREFSVAASDYTVSILADLLLRQVQAAAPRIRLQLHPIPTPTCTPPARAWPGTTWSSARPTMAFPAATVSCSATCSSAWWTRPTPGCATAP
jgi:DNA-binding transcriptional LysR family regulator